jgi:hypothetical protein
MSDKYNTLGPSPIVDEPYRWQHCTPGSSTKGYIVRWRARQQFLETATRLVPKLLDSLLTDNAIDLASQTPSVHREVSYPHHLVNYAQLLERSLFDRDDDLFLDTDWGTFDPGVDPRVNELDDIDQQVVLAFGRERIQRIWEERKTTRTVLDFPVWQVLRMFSRSESDGISEQDWLRSVCPPLWRHVADWTKQWSLDRPWAYLVATTTICEAAERVANGLQKPDRFMTPKSWEDWYAQNTGTPGGPAQGKRPQRRRTARGDHMEWLVLRHFLRRPAQKIAQCAGVKQQTVDRDTKRLAKFIGLDVRLARVGRPRCRTAHTICIPRQY